MGSIASLCNVLEMESLGLSSNMASSAANSGNRWGIQMCLRGDGTESNTGILAQHPPCSFVVTLHLGHLLGTDPIPSHPIPQPQNLPDSQLSRPVTFVQ